MKLERLPSGSWHCRKTINGVTYSLTFDHKPNKIELDNEVKRIQGNSSADHYLSVREAMEKYCKIKENILSSATIVNYKSIVRNLPLWFLNMKIDRVTSIDIQRLINEYAADHSPKSVRNTNGFISAVFGVFAPDLRLTIKLPQKDKRENYVPTDAEIAIVLKESKGTPYELCFRLAVYGLRKSEMLAIDKDSITFTENGALLTVNKAKVVSEDGTYHVKERTKTEAGTRQIYIDDDLAHKIIEKGCVYDGFPGNILRELNRIQERNGLQKFRLHDFRVYYASMCHNKLNIPDAIIMQSGGWKSQQTMTNVYRKAMTDEVLKQQNAVIDRLKKIATN